MVPEGLTRTVDGVVVERAIGDGQIEVAVVLGKLRDQGPVIRTEVFRKLVARERRERYDLFADNGFDVFRFRGGDACWKMPRA